MEKTLIQLKDICKVYNPGENEVRALDHINLEIMEGELVAIIGQYVDEYAGVSGCADKWFLLSSWAGCFAFKR